MTSDPRALIGILRNSHDRLAALVQPLGPDQLRAQSYDDDWTIAQVLSHLGSGAEIAELNLSAALTGTGEMDRDAFQPIWDAWNNRTPEAQAADCLAWDERHVSRLEQLTGERARGHPAGLLRPPAGRGRADPDAARRARRAHLGRGRDR